VHIKGHSFNQLIIKERQEIIFTSENLKAKIAKVNNFNRLANFCNLTFEDQLLALLMFVFFLAEYNGCVGAI